MSQIAPDRLFDAARWHGLLPALDRWCRHQPTPDPLADRVADATATIATRNLALAGTLRDLLAAFDAADVRAMPHKGPVLAERLYGDLARRPFRDLDLLVTPDAVDAAHTVLTDRGYEPEYAFTPVQERSHRRTGYHHRFFHPDRPGRVELHWRFVPAALGFPLDVATYHDRGTDQDLLNTTVRVPAPEDQFIVLALHGARHRWKRLKWLVDLARLIEVASIDWNLTRRRAERLGTRRSLHLALHLLDQLLQVDLPPEAARWSLATPAVDNLAAEVRHTLFDPAAEQPGELELTWFQARARERRRDRLATLAHSLLVPKAADFQALALPDAAFPLYYAYRPLRLAGASARTVLQG